ncbi:MAG: S8 family peptidase [Acidimicrobiales bacterium]
MSPQFGELQDALNAERATLAESTAATDPELVAVFDLAGTVDAFFKVAAKIPGLEFLFTVENDAVDPDDDFFFTDYSGDASDDLIPQSLYMVMTNARAITELIRLFEMWQADSSVSFDRGLGPLKQVFGLLRAIRRWGPRDRIRETGLLESWSDSVAIAGVQAIRAEVELWYRLDPTRRTEAQSTVIDAISRVGGTVISSSTIEDISYHGMLVELPRTRVEDVLHDGVEAIDLLMVEDIMFVSPAVQLRAELPHWRGDIDGEQLDRRQPTGDPQIAILDGVPLGGHVALTDRLVVDDPDGLTSHYTASQQCHGTAMASLIIHGPAETPGPAIRHPLYVRPVLRPHPHFTNVETFPDDELLVDLVHRSIRRIFEGDAGHPAAAPSVRVINLSIGDPARTFVRRMSPLARLLDIFAHRYNVVFVVSAGNHVGAATYPVVSPSSLDDAEKMSAEALQSLHTLIRQRRLLSPAEAINAITAGALHSDGGVTRALPSTVVDALPEGVPANYSSVGFGYHRAVKPEIFLPGGREVFQRPIHGLSDPVPLEPTTVPDVAGLGVAAPGHAGELSAIAITHGTSNSAALATRALARILEFLASPDLEVDDYPFPDYEYHPVIAKAMLVHAAAWGTLKDRLSSDLSISGPRSRHTLTQLLGYGVVHDEWVASATTHRVVLIGAATIHADQRHIYRFPLPPSLKARAEWKRLAVTLAWISDVNARTQKYRVARLRFNPPRDPLNVESTEAEGQAMTRGTVQHQVLEGRTATVFNDGDAVSIDVDCRIDVGSRRTETRYGLVASLEVGATVEADIHAEVRTALRTQVRDQVRERVRPQ